ncbi:hypothetical protein AKO1_005960, partial [Acrasis kona]
MHKSYSFVNTFSVAFQHLKYLHLVSLQKDGYRMPKENLFPVTNLVRSSIIRQHCFNESLIGGMEDWDLWMKLANNGYWGYTIREILFWYRIKPPDQRWEHISIDSNKAKAKMIERMTVLYPKVYTQGLPVIHQPQVIDFV